MNPEPHRLVTVTPLWLAQGVQYEEAGMPFDEMAHPGPQPGRSERVETFYVGSRWRVGVHRESCRGPRGTPADACLTDHGFRQ